MKLLIVLLLLSFGFQAQAQNLPKNTRRCNYELHGHGSPAEFNKVLSKINKVKSAKSLAKFAEYPMNLNGPNKKKIKSRSQFIKNSKNIWSEKVKKAVQTQLNLVWCDSQGLMLGKGNIWLRYKEGSYKIIAINP